LFSWSTLIFVAFVMIVVASVALAFISASARRPNNLGVKDGKLALCPPTPNCVCTQATDDAHRIAPLTFTGTAADAMARLRRIVIVQPRMLLTVQTETYLRAEFASLLFHFVDDVEFLIDSAAKVIHFRSASRTGRSDLGVNRRRMERIRRFFESKG
jgi:uncharacterized protein (DUF1499 family)